MSVKTMEVFECDLEDCGKLVKFGKLPDDWIWFLHEYEVATASFDGRASDKKVKKADEHEFCCREHLEAWIKQHGYGKNYVENWVKARMKPEAAAAWFTAHP